MAQDNRNQDRIRVSLACTAWALLFLLTYAPPAFADYVEVRLSAIVREQPTQRSAELDRPEIGATFQLLDNGRRSNRYYRIGLGDGRAGWIYSPRVARHAGDLPAPSPPMAALGATFSTPAGERIAVHYINVGQGAAALVEFPCAAIMIDAGAENAAAVPRLMRYLEAFFERRDDLNGFAAVFVTHTHVDHNRGLRALAERYEIGAYVHNGILRGSGRHNANWMLEHDNPSGTQIQMRAVDDAEVVGAGRLGFNDGVIDSISCPGVNPRIRILSARQDQNPGWSEDEFVNGNNQSLVIRIDFGEASFLFTGDLEEPAIETMVDYYGRHADARRRCLSCGPPRLVQRHHTVLVAGHDA